MKPYYEDDFVQLYHGDWRELIPGDFRADLILTDPPYGETSLEWDRWPEGWPTLAARHANAMWCFGSMRMLLDRRDEFAGWKLSQDVVWEKHNGSGFHADRFRRVHEHATHWYRGDWADIHHETPVTHDATARTVRSKRRPAHTGQIDRTPYVSHDAAPHDLRYLLAVDAWRRDQPHREARSPPRAAVGLRLPARRDRPRPVRRISLHPRGRQAHRAQGGRLRTARGAVRVRRQPPRARRAAAGGVMTHPLPLRMCHNCGTLDAREWVNIGAGLWACWLCYWPTGRPPATDETRSQDGVTPMGFRRLTW